MSDVDQPRPGEAGYSPLPSYPGGGVQPQPVSASELGPLGEVRGTGTVILLSIITLGIYTWIYWYRVHEEMKRHSGVGIGGGLALLLAILINIVMPFITSSEVGDLYERRGARRPVTAITGLWVLLPVVGWFVWIVKTNGALNRYWESLGAR